MTEMANQDAQILAQMDSLEADAKQYPMIGAIQKIGPTLLPEYKEAASPGFIPGIEYLDAKYPKGKYQSFPPLSSLRHLPVPIRVIWLYRVSVNSHHNMLPRLPSRSSGRQLLLSSFSLLILRVSIDIITTRRYNG